MTLDEYRQWAAQRCDEVPYVRTQRPCLIWRGATINKGRDPRAVMRPGFPPAMVRREAWAIYHPNDPLGKDSARPACGCQLCVEPSHLERVSQSEYHSVPKSAAAKLRMQAVARERRSTVKAPTIIVPRVKEMEGPAWKVAQELGLGVDVIRDIRAGKWDRAAFGASPFAGLGARLAANDHQREQA